MPESRVLVVGDIHGCYNKLIELMDIVEFDPERDFFVFLGDLIDRGGQEFSVVKKVREMVDRRCAAVIRGNHEQMAVDAFESGEYYRQLWKANGGYTTLESYSKNNADLREDIEFFKSLPYFWKINDDIICVHAGLRPGIPLESQDKRDLLWIREEFIFSNYDFGFQVIFGHTPFDSVTSIPPRKIGVDTGCFFTGKLSCLELPSGKVYETPA